MAFLDWQKLGLGRLRFQFIYFLLQSSASLSILIIFLRIFLISYCRELNLFSVTLKSTRYLINLMLTFCIAQVALKFDILLFETDTIRGARPEFFQVCLYVNLLTPFRVDIVPMS